VEKSSEMISKTFFRPALTGETSADRSGATAPRAIAKAAANRPV
jgi:hypothetical protein